MIPEDEIANYEDFRDCVSELLISRLSGAADKKKKKATKGRKNEIKPVNKPEQGQEDNDALVADLGETIEVCQDFLVVACPNSLMLIHFRSILLPRYSLHCLTIYESCNIVISRITHNLAKSTTYLWIQTFTRTYYNQCHYLYRIH